MRWTEQVRANRSGADCCTAASFKALEFVGVKKIDLPVADSVNDGPMIPHSTAHADQYGSFAPAFEK